MKILLDENFPVGLVRVLQQDGHEVEHIITLGWRGASDGRIRERLRESKTVFLTHDEDFLVGEVGSSIVVVSHVRQTRRLAERIEVWRTAIGQLQQLGSTEHFFELTDGGDLVPGRPSSSRTALVGRRVLITVTDPWEFGTEHGTGPFVGQITAAREQSISIALERPLVFLGETIVQLVASPRHQGRSFAGVSNKPVVANLTPVCERELLQESDPFVIAATRRRWGLIGDLATEL